MQAEKKKLEVGDVLYSKTTLRQSKKENNVIQGKIKRVGKKYIYTDHWQMEKVPIEHIFSEQNIQSGFYFTNLQDIGKREAFYLLIDTIKAAFPTYGRVNLTLSQLQRINAIINE